MACDCNYLRLLVALVELAQQLRGLKAVHDGHGQVHQDECVGIIFFKALLGHLYADLAVVGGVNQLNNTWESAKCFHHHFEPNLVEHLVVDDQDTAPVCPIRKSYVLELENVVDLVAFLVRGISDALLRLHYIVLRIIPFALVFDLLQLTLLRNVDLGRHFIPGIVDDPLVLVLL